MKSRPYVLYLVLGVAALSLWLAWPSGHRPAEVRPALPVVTPSSSPDLARASVQPAVVLPGGGPPPGTPTVVGDSGTAPGQALAVAPSSLRVDDAAGPAGVTNQAAQTDVGRVRHMISDYHTLAGENPVGTNAEIMKQMTGGNSRQATLGPPEGIALNAQGELVDQWGSPYFFHQLSRDKMEVRSAGPDKMMWTADDVIAR